MVHSVNDFLDLIPDFLVRLKMMSNRRLLNLQPNVLAWMNLYPDTLATVWYRTKKDAEWKCAEGTLPVAKPSNLQVRRVELKAGDYLLIPKHVKHRVAATSADAVWLAVHFTGQSES